MKHGDQNLNQIFFFVLWLCGIHYHKLLVDNVRALSTASGLYWLLLRGSLFAS